MLMKWEDLEVGDRVKYTDELIEFYQTIHNLEVSAEIIIISKITLYDNFIIVFYNNNQNSDMIRYNGRGLSLFYQDGPIFKIVELHR